MDHISFSSAQIYLDASREMCWWACTSKKKTFLRHWAKPFFVSFSVSLLCITTHGMWDATTWNIFALIFKNNSTDLECKKLSFVFAWRLEDERFWICKFAKSCHDDACRVAFGWHIEPNLRSECTWSTSRFRLCFWFPPHPGVVQTWTKGGPKSTPWCVITSPLWHPSWHPPKFCDLYMPLGPDSIASETTTGNSQDCLAFCYWYTGLPQIARQSKQQIAQIATHSKQQKQTVILSSLGTFQMLISCLAQLSASKLLTKPINKFFLFWLHGVLSVTSVCHVHGDSIYFHV